MQLQRPSLIQEQRQLMSQQQVQSVELLALPVMQLREQIDKMLEKNPALEVVREPAEVNTMRFHSSNPDRYWGRRPGGMDADQHQAFIEGALSREETLQEHLLSQLALQPIDGELRLICERLIQNLNGDGFHCTPPASLFDHQTPAGRPDRLGEALALVQSLDPPGVCTADYREALLVQIRLLRDTPGAAVPAGIEAALDQLALLEQEKFAEAAKKMNAGGAAGAGGAFMAMTFTAEDARLCYQAIRELSPFPGRQYAGAEVRYVVPDVRVVRREGEPRIILNNEEIPVLDLNPFFKELGGRNERKGGGSAAARDFARENLREARWFIASIDRRNRTLLRLSRAIVKFQRAFFYSGPKYLSPLTQKDIAEELGLDDSTISRAARGKYMQTEWGIFELRHFFTNSISGAGSTGSQYSKEGVKEVIRELLDGAKGAALKDQDIAELLRQRGINLARRTVTKYRKELGIDSSYRR